jgi:hypothetical protein
VTHPVTVTIRLWGPKNLSLTEMDEIAGDLEENPNQDWWDPTYQWVRKSMLSDGRPGNECATAAQ